MSVCEQCEQLIVYDIDMIVCPLSSFVFDCVQPEPNEERTEDSR